MLVACRLAGLSALEADYAAVKSPTQSPRPRGARYPLFIVEKDTMEPVC
jgi:hypothetical protein